jgi:TPR repeat protein
MDDVVQKDEERAIELLKEAANADEPEALNYLGLIYEKGSRTVEKSYDKCVEYLKMSQKLGHENASINLALLQKQNVPTGRGKNECIGDNYMNIKPNERSTKVDNKEYLTIISTNAKRGNDMSQIYMESIKKENNISLNKNEEAKDEKLNGEKELVNFEKMDKTTQMRKEMR